MADFGSMRKVFKNTNNLQLIISKSGFLKEKAHFFGSKTVDQHFGANLKKLFFAKI